jgi:hypothetical protein
LFKQSAFEFERWAVSLVGGKPNKKQVADKGVDGVMRFFTDKKKSDGRILVSVKGGATVNPAWVRDLIGTVDSEKAEMGVLILAARPTKGVVDAAARSGLYKWPPNQQNYARVQVMTIEQLLKGEKPDTPPILSPYISAKRQAPPTHQLLLGVDDEVPDLAEDEPLTVDESDDDDE